MYGLFLAARFRVRTQRKFARAWCADSVILELDYANLETLVAVQIVKR